MQCERTLTAEARAKTTAFLNCILIVVVVEVGMKSGVKLMEVLEIVLGINFG